jgi:putative nucleotidyltransferase with HDIG domain
MGWPTRREALDLLHGWTESANLRKHAYAVEAAMRAYARRLGGDEEQWAVAGLLHDFDYERHPSMEDHPRVGVQHIRDLGWPEDLAAAILAHAEHTGAVPGTPLEKALFAVDELSGLVVAVALVRPSRRLSDVSVESILKKWGEQRFAAGVDRSLIERGAAELGVPLEEHIRVVLQAMQGIAEELGL